MKTCVYYSLEEIRPEDIHAVQTYSAGENLVHICKEDAFWPDELEIDHIRMPSPRSADYRNQLMMQLNQLYEKIQANPVARAIFPRGTDFWEIVRYEWFFSICEIVYPTWIIEQIVSECHPEKLIYVYSPKHDLTNKTKILKVLGSKNIGVVIHPTSIHIATRDTAANWWLYWKIVFSEIKAISKVAAKKIFQRGTGYHKKRKVSKHLSLFIENFPNSAKISAEVAKTMDDMGANTLFIATNTQVQTTVDGTKKSVLLENFIPATLDLMLIPKLIWISVSVFLLTYFWPSFEHLSGNEITTIAGLNFFRVTAKSWRRAIIYKDKFALIVKKLSPKSITTTSIFGIFARSMLAVSRLKIPTFFVQHGLMFMDKYEKHILQKYALVWGEHTRAALVRNGFAEGNIFVTGSPKFSYEPTEEYQRQISKKSYFHVVYFPSLVGGNTLSVAVSKKMLDSVIKAISDIPNCRLTIKIKDTDRNAIFKELDEYEFIQVSRGYNATEILRQADTVIVSTSTVGLEACFYGKPLIVLDSPGIQLFPVYKEFNAALFAVTAEEISEHLKFISNHAPEWLLLPGQVELVRTLFSDSIESPDKKIAEIILQNGYE